VNVNGTVEKKTRNWLLVALAIAGFCFVVLVAAVGGMVYFVASHVDTATASPGAAGDRFAEVRRRFAGRQPIVEITGDDHAVVRQVGTLQAAGGASAPARLENLNVLVYDRNDERIIEVTVPFWLLRIMPSGRFSINDDRVRIDSERLHLTVADLERYGPALVLDHEELRGRGTAQVLVWTE
jgi:hypothetical protein